jgi:hypothetical protein
MSPSRQTPENQRQAMTQLNADYQALAAKLQQPMPLDGPAPVFPENGNPNLERETSLFRQRLQGRLEGLLLGAGLEQLVEFDAWLDDAAREIFRQQVAA